MASLLSRTQSQSGPQRPTRARFGFRRLFILFLVLLPLLNNSIGTYGTPPVAQGDELSDAQARAKALAAKIAAQKAQLAKLSALQASLSDDIAQTQTQLKGINQDLSAVKARVTRMSANVAAVQATYDGLVAEIDGLEAQLGQLAMYEMVKSDELVGRKEILAARLRAANAAGDQSLLETILSAESFTDALADVGYYLDIGDQDKALADAIAPTAATRSRPTRQTSRASPRRSTTPAPRRTSCASRRQTRRSSSIRSSPRSSWPNSSWRRSRPRRSTSSRSRHWPTRSSI